MTMMKVLRSARVVLAFACLVGAAGCEEGKKYVAVDAARDLATDGSLEGGTGDVVSATGGVTGSGGAASSGGMPGSGGSADAMGPGADGQGGRGVDGGPGVVGTGGPSATGGISTGGAGLGSVGSGGTATATGGAGSGGAGSGGVGSGGVGSGGAGSGGAGTGGVGAGACTSGMHKCVGTQPQVCGSDGTWRNMGSPCAVCTACDAATGSCVPTAGGSCDDGNACTQTDTCQGGVCVGSNTKACTASDQCHQAGVCNPSTGACSNPAKSDGQSCNDGMACTQPDTCQSGACVGTPILCNSPPACKQVTTCSAGACNYSQNVPNGTADAKCTAGTPFCFSGSCVQCTGDQDCAGATPTCDTSAHTCVCRRKSAGNQLKNGGFDGSLSSWTAYNAMLVADSEGCSGSKAIYVDNGEEDPNQCIQLTPGTYYIGGRFRKDDATTLGDFIRVNFSAAADCSNPTSNYDFSLVFSTTWSRYWTTFSVPAGTMSARVGVFGIHLFADQIYVNASNQF